MFEGYDKVILLDKNNHNLKTYGDYDGVNYQNFWTEWYTGDTLKVKLVTDGSRTDYGFKVDDVETKLSESNILTTTELVSSDNSYTFGQPVTLTAKIDIPSQATEKLSGKVTFMDGTTPIGTVDVNSGKASLTTSSLSSGSHSVTAEYSGDNNFRSSKSPAFTLTVQEQPSSEEQAPKIGQNVSTENSNTEPFKTNKESIWGNPVFIIIIVATVFVGIVLTIKNEEFKTILSQNSLVRDIIAGIVSGLILLVVGIIIQN